MDKTIAAKRKQRFLLSCLLFLLLFALLMLFFFALPAMRRKQEKNAALLQIQEGASSHNAFFLSMYPIGGFSEEAFHTYEGLDLMKLSFTIPDYDMFLLCLEELQRSCPNPQKLYLGLDPLLLTKEQVSSIPAMFPNTDLSILLAPRSLEEWCGIKEIDASLAAYRSITDALTSQPRVKVYPFFAQEWVIANPENYINSMELREDISLRLFLYGLFEEETRDCRIRPEETEELFVQLRQLISDTASGTYAFPDLSSWKIVFIGDSVIGNFIDRRSIPAYLHDLAGATTYNCGWGGATAASVGTQSLEILLNGLIEGATESLPEESQAYIGLSEVRSRESQESLDDPHTLFVLHFGINDYYKGLPLDAADPLDTGSCSGAMRNGIERLRAAYPHARLLMILPNHVFLFGEGTEPMGEEGHVYEDYINALTEIAKAYQLPVLDDYHQIINSEKSYVHVDDGTHPNDYGRFQIAYALMRLIADQLEETY